MAATEGDILRDEQERSNWLKAIADIETAIVGSIPGTRRVLENTLDNAKKRIVVLDKKIEDAKVERAAEQQAQTAAAIMAAKETKLNANEQETYRGFLEESYFTRRDFGRLDEFYKHSYDHLSEDGKDQMSKRIDEGIRRGEFKFTDLSKSVQNKEAERHAAKAREDTSIHDHVSKRDDTINPSTADTKASTTKEIDLGSISLDGVKLTDATAPPNASSIPSAPSGKVFQRSV